MATGTHAKKHAPIPWMTYIGILLIGLGLGVVIGLMIAPHDTAIIAAHAGTHIGTHLKPNTGRIIARIPKAKQVTHNALTAVQAHAHHLWHVRHVRYLHAEHVQHLDHMAHEAAMLNSTRSLADSFGKVITVR